MSVTQIKTESHRMVFIVMSVNYVRIRVPKRYTGKRMGTEYWLSTLKVGLPRKNVVRFTGCPDMTLAIYTHT